MINTDIAGKLDVNQITNRLAMMDDTALQTYAKLHKNDPFLLPLAVSESNRRKARRAAAQAQQYTPQPPVNDAQIAQMQAPAPQMQAPQMQAPAPQMAAAGIPQLAARNIETMADGGIAGYAEGSTKPIFNADKYLEDPRVQRFLEYINVSEGSPQPNQMVGYRRFDDMSKHPNKRIKFNKRGDKSSAAGAYQIINSTWQEQAKKQGLTDFSLENQKRAAVGLLKETGALDALLAGDVEKAKRLAARKWASIPGSTIGASTGQKARFNERAEALLKDLTPQTVAQRPAEPARKPKPKQREEFAGLSPDLARQITSALPFASAQAADKKAASAASAAPAAPAGKPTPDLRYKDVPGTPDALEYERQLRAARGPEPSWLEQRKREILGAPGALLSATTGAVSPLTGTLYAAGRTLAGKPTTAEEGFGAVTYTPTGEYEKESLAQMQRAFEDFKLPPFIPGVGTTSAKPKAGRAVAKAEAAAAEATAAAEAAKTAEAPRLEAPKSAPTRASELQQRFAEAQERSAKANETADLLATSVVDGKVMTGKEKAAALRASMPKTEGFTPDPAAQQLGVEALLRRKRAEQAADVRKAKDAAAVAERKAAEAAGLAEKEKGLDVRDKAFAEARRQAEVQSNYPSLAVLGSTAAGRAAASAPEVGESEDAAKYMQPYSYGFDYGQNRAAPAPAPAPAPEEKAPVPEEKDKPFGLDREDLLMLGLGMLASPGGQAGGDLSQLFQNLGRSGLSTVAMKREREKLAEEKDYKNVMKKYYGKLTEMYGRPEAEERQIAQVMQEYNVDRIEAIRRIYEAKYASRGEDALEAAKIRALGPFAGLIEGGLMNPAGGDLTPAGRDVFAKYYPTKI